MPQITSITAVKNLHGKTVYLPGDPAGNLVLFKSHRQRSLFEKLCRSHGNFISISPDNGRTIAQLKRFYGLHITYCKPTASLHYPLIKQV